MPKLSIFQILILSMIGITIKNSSIFAIESTFPIRTGRLRIDVSSPVNQTRTFNMTFFLPLSSSPTGIVNGVSSLLISNNSCPYLDYSLESQNLTKTGYTLNINLAYTYQIQYSTFSVNYFTQAGANQFYTFSTLPSSMYTSDTNTSGIFTRKWSWVLSSSSTLAVNYSFNCFIQKITARFPSYNFLIEFNQSYNSSNYTVSVTYSFSSDIVITTLVLGGIFYNNKFNSVLGTTYELKGLSTFNLSSIPTKNFDIQNFPFPNIFLGLNSINCTSDSTKISFFNAYSPATTNYSYLDYTQNPKNTLISRQYSSPYLDYFVLFYYYARISCANDPSYPYLDYQAQLCYDDCPLGKYSNSSQFCLKCTDCSDISNCNSCYSNGCSTDYYFNVTILPYKCSSCSLNITDCKTCFSNSSGVFCSQCNPNMPIELAHSQKSCNSCNSSSYFNPTNKKCYSCSLISQDCGSCSTGSVCNSCTILSQKQLINGNCQSCNSTSYYNPATKTCFLCSSLISNCEQCSSSSANSCTKCSVASLTTLVGGICVFCDSDEFLNSTTNICNLCDSQISGCRSCEINGSNILECHSCDYSLELELSGNQCVGCNSSSYFDSGDNSCHSCSQYCVSCTSANVCVECGLSPSTLLENDACVLCNPDHKDLNSSLPFCTSQIPLEPVVCVLSTYNPITKKCELIEASEVVISSFTVIASVPTLSMFTRTFVALIGLFDDLSYYSYHGRNYTTSVQMFFDYMNDFTLSRFVPFQIQKVYDSIKWGYSYQILQEDLSRTPEEFEKNDGSVYFLKNTESIWTISLPLSLLLFSFFFGVHWLVNKFIKNNFFKNYNYFGMIVVDQVGSNIQYFTFRVFSQFYQLAVLGPVYYANITISYFVLLVVLVYSVASSVIFSSIYSNASADYILFDLFGQSWVVWFNVSNLIKMFTGFVHAFFYYSPLVQNVLLTVAYVIKAIIYSLTFKYIQSSFQFTFELLSIYLMMVLQCFFLTDMVLMSIFSFTPAIQQYHGNIQCLLIIGMTATHIMSTIVMIVKNGVLFFKKRVQNIIQKELIQDIRIIKMQSPRFKKGCTPTPQGLLQRRNKVCQITEKSSLETQSYLCSNKTTMTSRRKLISRNRQKKKLMGELKASLQKRCKMEENSITETKKIHRKIIKQDYELPVVNLQVQKPAVLRILSGDISEIQQLSFSKKEFVERQTAGVFPMIKKRRIQSFRKIEPPSSDQGENSKNSGDRALRRVGFKHQVFRRSSSKYV